MARQKRRSDQKSSPTGHIRLISGKYRGRKLPVLMADGLRPTTDRVKETVFNWLMPYIQDRICLDCFAGAGSLGFEAASRGAKAVTLLELNKNAVAQLQSNKLTLKADNIDIHKADSLNYLKSANEKFDLVFIDPPFNKGLADKTIQLLEPEWLTEDALIYVEVEQNGLITIPESWQLLKEKQTGQVYYRLYQRK